jgi:hypothetical protein
VDLELVNNVLKEDLVKFLKLIQYLIDNFLLKKKNKFIKQKLLKEYYKPIEFSELLKKSLFKNHFINYKSRLSFSIQKNYNLFNLFKTLQRLICLVTLSVKVPNKKFNYSRFYLNKQLNKLTISNTLK